MMLYGTVQAEGAMQKAAMFMGPGAGFDASNAALAAMTMGPGVGLDAGNAALAANEAAILQSALPSMNPISMFRSNKAGTSSSSRTGMLDTVKKILGITNEDKENVRALARKILAEKAGVDEGSLDMSKSIDGLDNESLLKLQEAMERDLALEAPLTGLSADKGMTGNDLADAYYEVAKDQAKKLGLKKPYTGQDTLAKK